MTQTPVTLYHRRDIQSAWHVGAEHRVSVTLRRRSLPLSSLWFVAEQEFRVGILFVREATARREEELRERSSRLRERVTADKQRKDECMHRQH